MTNIHIIFYIYLSISILNFQKCGNEAAQANSNDEEAMEKAVSKKETVVGAARFDQYLPLVEGKSIAMVVNQTSRVGGQHLVDTLLKKGVSITRIFAPEHGFRGKADAGEHLSDSKDARTGIPIVSLFGTKKKPSSEDLQGVDVVLFDIQDVGTRFYTYISTMHYVMEACVDQRIPFIVLDRPNPNGHYVDGPIREAELKSFVGLHPIPIVHGLTVGELAMMINGEGWLENGKRCDLEVITCQQYDHNTFYFLPVKPSPNLPNMRSIYLYPSLCLFEGTVVSVGRGTATPFQIIGHPDYPEKDFSFTPRPTEGAQNPKLNGQKCYGISFTGKSINEFKKINQLDFTPIFEFYQKLPNKENFFLPTNFFDKLAGTPKLKQQIIAGKTMEEIRQSWEPGLSQFKEKRKGYLLY